MKRNQLILLIVLVAAVGGVGLLLYKKENQSWTGSDQQLGQKLFKDFPLNDVTHVVIRQSTNELNLVRQNDQWTVQERANYPANFSQISELLRKMWEMKVAQPQNATATQLPRFELVPPGAGTNTGTLVEFKGAGGKTLQTLLLGKKHMREGQASSPFGGGGWPDGRYVMVGDNVKTVALVTDPLTDVEAKAEPWVDKEFFKVEKLKSVSVTATNETNSWTVTRDTEQGEWKFAQPKPNEELDKSKVASVGTALSAPSFTDVLPPDKPAPAEIGLEKARVATLETFDHVTYKISVGDTNSEGNYYLRVDVSANVPKERTPAADEKPEDKERLDKEFKDSNAKVEEKVKKEEKFENWTYVVSKWTIDPLLKDRKDLLAEKKEEAATTPPPTSPAPDQSPIIPLTPPANPAAPKVPPLLAPPPAQVPPPLPKVEPARSPKTEAKPEAPKPVEGKPAEPKPGQ